MESKKDYYAYAYLVTACTNCIHFAPGYHALKDLFLMLSIEYWQVR